LNITGLNQFRTATVIATMAAVQLKNQWRAFGGYLRQYTHFSRATQTNMTFSVYLPPAAESGKRVPLLWYLSGLTCTDDNFCQKAGAQRAASKAGIALVAPDTSPRGANIEGNDGNCVLTLVPSQRFSVLR
jgi:S-formylglutathione hydrolase